MKSVFVINMWIYLSCGFQQNLGATFGSSSDDRNTEKSNVTESLDLKNIKEEDTRGNVLQNTVLNDILIEIMHNQNLQKQMLSLIDYKLSAMDVKTQDKLNMVQRQVNDLANRMQEIDWFGNNLEGAVEILRAEINGLKQALDYRKMNEGCTADYTETKMNQVMLTLRRITGQINNIRDSVNSINSNVMSLDKNTSLLLAITRNLSNTCPIPSSQPLLLPKDIKIQKKRSNETIPRDCFDVLRQGINVSSVYKIQPSEYQEPFIAVCDMDTMGGGWTVFQMRYDGTTHFFRDWADYKNGFGNMAEEFWLGLDKLHMITNSRPNDLLVHLEDTEGQTAWAYYEHFSVGNTDQDYAITSLGHYHGNAGDSLRTHIHKFSTQDRDNDMNEAINCARSGAWWYMDCEDTEQYSSTSDYTITCSQIIATCRDGLTSDFNVMNQYYYQLAVDLANSVNNVLPKSNPE